MNENSSQSGFTLIELLIVITLVAVLAAFSSSFSFLITRSAAQSSQMELIGFINTARTTAIMESTNVTLCPINTENGKCSSDWSRDIIAFRDPNRSRQLVDIKQIVRTLQPNSNGVFYGNAGIRKYFGFRGYRYSKRSHREHNLVPARQVGRECLPNPNQYGRPPTGRSRQRRRRSSGKLTRQPYFLLTLPTSTFCSPFGPRRIKGKGSAIIVRLRSFRYGLQCERIFCHRILNKAQFVKSSATILWRLLKRRCRRA